MLGLKEALSYFPWLPQQLGVTEWGTGLMFINRPKHDFVELRAHGTQTLAARNFAVALTHETYHTWQFALTGYMYRFACKYLALVRAQLRRHYSDEDTLRHTLANPPPVGQDTEHLLKELQREGSQRITVFDLIESSATAFEFLQHYTPATPTNYKVWLEEKKQERPAAYYRAYEVFSDVLGPHRVLVDMLFATTTALLFDAPQDVYVDVLCSLQAYSSAEIARNPMEVAKKIIFSFAQRHRALGTAADVLDRAHELGIARHPIYAALLDYLGNAVAPLSPLALLTSPSAWTLDVAKAILQPLVFTDGLANPQEPNSPTYDINDLAALLLLAILIVRWRVGGKRVLGHDAV